MNPNSPIQTLAFDPGAPIAATAEPCAVSIVDDEERPYTVEVPKPACGYPQAIEQVVNLIGNLADRVGKSTILVDRFAVQRMLFARYTGETNMERIATAGGIKRQSLYRLLERGESKEHPAYEAFYAAFHQLHDATVFNSLEAIRQAAHSNNWKAAEAHLKLTAPEMGAVEKSENVTVQGDVNIQINGKSIHEASTQELLEAWTKNLGSFSNAALQVIKDKLPANVTAMFEQRHD
jgi:hypothetical protein